MNIDWELFKKQKEYLVAMTNDDDRLTEEIRIIEGVIHLMDAIQDEMMPVEQPEPEYVKNQREERNLWAERE